MFGRTRVDNFWEDQGRQCFGGPGYVFCGQTRMGGVWEAQHRQFFGKTRIDNVLEDQCLRIRSRQCLGCDGSGF